MAQRNPTGSAFDLQSSNGEDIFFSICIPQFNRTSFLLKAMESFRYQSFRAFEVCISDGGSTDGRWKELVDFLKASGLMFRFQRHDRNLRYDANLRASIDLARGRYCFLMGNDDELATPQSLQVLHDKIMAHPYPGAVITNYLEIPSGKAVLRMRRERNLGSGPEVAAANFRNYSFVSGVLLDRIAALDHSTERWDGAEMYQMYLGTRIVSGGRDLLSVTDLIVRKDVQVLGEAVDSYAIRPRLHPCPIQPRSLPLCKLGALVVDALEPALAQDQMMRQRIIRKVYGQFLTFPYTYWVIQYRKIQSFRFAIGICLGMSPSRITSGLDASLTTSLFIRSIYCTSTFIGLLTPTRLFEVIRPWLYRFAKRA